MAAVNTIRTWKRLVPRYVSEVKHGVEVAQDGTLICVLLQIEILPISIESWIFRREVIEASMVDKVVVIDLVCGAGAVLEGVVNRQVCIYAVRYRFAVYSQFR